MLFSLTNRIEVKKTNQRICKKKTHLKKPYAFYSKHKLPLNAFCHKSYLSKRSTTG